MYSLTTLHRQDKANVLANLPHVNPKSELGSGPNLIACKSDSRLIFFPKFISLMYLYKFHFGWVHVKVWLPPIWVCLCFLTLCRISSCVWGGYSVWLLRNVWHLTCPVIPESQAPGQQSLDWTWHDAAISQQHHLLGSMASATGMPVVIFYLLISAVDWYAVHYPSIS